MTSPAKLIRGLRIKKDMLPWNATVAHIVGQQVASGETEVTDEYETTDAKADVQPVALQGRGLQGMQIESFGIEERYTHIGTFGADVELEIGDLVKFLDGPEAGNHFVVRARNPVESHHLEPLLDFQRDHTLNDTVGNL